MAIDFPASPTLNDEYSFEGRTWRWNATGWEVKEYPAALLAGTAANPSLYFSGDPNTGLYSPGADQVAISTGGAGRLFVDASGRVGIGTSAPADLFQVIGGNIAADNTDGRRIAFNIGDTFSASVTTATYGLTRGPAGTNTIGLSGFAGLGFYTNNTERARIDSSGRLLVGTSSNISSYKVQIIDSNPIDALRYAASAGGPFCRLAKSRSATPGSYSVVLADDTLGTWDFAGDDGAAFISAARISAAVDGTPGANDMPGRLVFSTTADGAAVPTERMRITSAGVLQVADAGNITVGTTTGTKIGTATTQKLGFYNATPVVQPAAVANATDAASVITQLNDLLAKLRTLGIIAT